MDYLVPGGGLADHGRTWVKAKADFLVQVKPLAALFRAKPLAALRQTALWSEIPATVWQQPWVVDCGSVGSGRAALKYLAPYIFRVALSNKRIVRVAADQVTFRDTVGDTGQTAYCTLPVQELLRRFLQQSLPKGFGKVRYSGLFRLGMRRNLSRLRSQVQLLQLIAVEAVPAPAAREGSTRVLSCSSCGQPMRVERVLLPHNRGPPSRAAQSLKPHSSMCWRRLGRASQSHACLSVPASSPRPGLRAIDAALSQVSILLSDAHSPIRGHGWHACEQLRPLTTLDHHFGQLLAHSTPT